MKKEINYVLGFAFELNRNFVALIEKNRPEFQKGKINGIGGKIEDADFFKAATGPFTTPQIAMVREFTEETGKRTKPNDWDYFATMTFENDILGGRAVVHCLRAFLPTIRDIETTTDEKVNVYGLPLLNHYQLSPNLKMLIEIALNKDVKKVNLFL